MNNRLWRRRSLHCALCIAPSSSRDVTACAPYRPHCCTAFTETYRRPLSLSLCSNLVVDHCLFHSHTAAVAQLNTGSIYYAKQRHERRRNICSTMILFVVIFILVGPLVTYNHGKDNFETSLFLSPTIGSLCVCILSIIMEIR